MDLGRILPLANVMVLALISLAFIALFAHLHFYRGLLAQYVFDYVKRVVAISHCWCASDCHPTVSMSTEWLLAVKRIVIVAFPASLSATVADAFK